MESKVAEHKATARLSGTPRIGVCLIRTTHSHCHRHSHSHRLIRRGLHMILIRARMGSSALTLRLTGIAP